MEQLRKTETIVYGGAFNPPTLAHVAILRACFEYAQAENAEVWVMPSGDRPDKKIPVAREHRLACIGAFIVDAARNEGDIAEVVTTELDRTVPVETVDTVDELEAMHPERRFTFVFGADSTETMQEWKGGERLLETLPMLVVPREGSSVNPRAAHAQVLSLTTPPVSSTQVRQCMERHEPLTHLVSPSVAALLL